MNNYILAVCIALAGIPLVYLAKKIDKYYENKEKEQL